MNSRTIPSKYWLFVWGVMFVFFAFSIVAYTPAEPVSGIITAIAVACLFTLWLAAIHLLWFADSTLYKIIAIIIAGIFAVLIVILIQYLYEKIIFDRRFTDK